MEIDSAGKKISWTSLEHDGPVFPPNYERLPDGVHLEYNGSPFFFKRDLAEEMAVAYAKLGTRTLNPIAKENFFADWRRQMTPKERKTIVNLENCNFDIIRRHPTQSSSTPLQKKYCKLNGHETEISYWYIRPPGIYRCKSEANPKNGKWKRRLKPEDVTINCSRGFEPPAPPGHRWAKIVSQPNDLWLARWYSPIERRSRYMIFSRKSEVMGILDCGKYAIAAKLGTHLDDIRTEYRKNFNSTTKRDQQLALALYFVDRFAFRAGYKKNENGTFGNLTLQRKHITLIYGQPRFLQFNFLGKASVPTDIKDTIPDEVFNAVNTLLGGKADSDKIFDCIFPAFVNGFLQKYDKGLSMQAFRTYRASALFEKNLKTKSEDLNANSDIKAKLRIIEDAFREVAKLCNHKKRSDDGSYTYATTTCKKNYVDPRIVVAWCIKYNVPIEKVYWQPLREQFKWAIEAACEDYVFTKTRDSDEPGPSRRKPKPSIKDYCFKNRQKTPLNPRWVKYKAVIQKKVCRRYSEGLKNVRPF